MKRRLGSNLYFTIAFTAVLFLLLLSACKKKNVKADEPQAPSKPPIPILYPSRYLAAYPGSYWIYKTKKGGTETYTVTMGPEYVHDSVNTVFFMTPKYEHAMVPVCNNQKLWGTKTYYYSYPNNNGLCAEEILIDSNAVKGQRMSTYRSTLSMGENYRTTLAVDTTLLIDGKRYYNVIATRTYYQLNGGGRLSISTDKYYAKDIGLIATYSYNFILRDMKPTDPMPLDSIVYSCEISNFHINK